MRIASIDIGTNSVLLLVVERVQDRIEAVLERATITRLGEGVDATGVLAPEARERTLRCLSGYAEEARLWGAERILSVGTSALRDAHGGAGFTEEVAAVLGEAPRVISGEEEARLTFRGALSGLTLSSGPTVVFDIGGGSTELIFGQVHESHVELEHAISLDMGSVRLTERYLHEDPPSLEEIQEMEVEIDRQLTHFSAHFSGHLVGVAGTVTTLAAVARGVAPYDAAQIHGTSLSVTEVSELASRLAALSVRERCAIVGMPSKRADVIVAGALLVEHVLRKGAWPQLTVSDRGVRWGVALEALEGRL